MGFKVKDHYFNKAKKDNYFARSIYKLEEIDKKYSVIKKGDSVLDLGYHPGSWIQYSSKKVGTSGEVIGIDIKEINLKVQALPNVRVYKKDVNDISELADLEVEKKFDVVVSDMAPNTTGIKSVDQVRSLQLVEMVFYHLPQFLKKEGNFVIKVFDSHEAQTFLKQQKKLFKKFEYLKPKSTRSVSKEFFVIGMGYK
ncbi:MAG: RlmE family RNA methyltransferase [Bacteriovoracaceae bacterium]|jgi:23S rRNA (uridine2552-2'-O)-methyltransferase|nr:50S rRNA methyltransferase [Halobacteriovoraceae bacterium]MDP7321279.1 RlmE family RNA methyltransferase [Bacteriovoracaceae bacterium]|tara:strand:+ start:129 stop:719 length:591 start_codon:yes stop_codon:yes gene_type:complete